MGGFAHLGTHGLGRANSFAGEGSLAEGLSYCSHHFMKKYCGLRTTKIRFRARKGTISPAIEPHPGSKSYLLIFLIEIRENCAKTDLICIIFATLAENAGHANYPHRGSSLRWHQGVICQEWLSCHYGKGWQLAPRL